MRFMTALQERLIRNTQVQAPSLFRSGLQVVDSRFGRSEVSHHPCGSAKLKMFVIPPPPRYPTANGMAPPPLETNNILSHPEGPKISLQVGEGTYGLRNDLQLSTPPPHPSEATIVNPNPLATSIQPPTSGTRLSLVILTPRRPTPQFYKLGSTTTGFSSSGLLTNRGSIQEKPVDTTSNNGSTTSSGAPAFGEGNTALSFMPSKEALKRRKPKNNIVKSSSSFVSRVILHETLVKQLQDRDPAATFIFANVNRAFQWLDTNAGTKYQDPLAKILFTKAHMLCHDVNEVTKSASHLDVIMGSSAGDILWYEPISQKYARLNKNGMINETPVSHIKWIPGSENLFLAAHMDGTLVVYDKEKEDAPFAAEDVAADDSAISDDEEEIVLNVAKSVNSSNQKSNPVACWRLSNQCINDFAFSPDSRHLAVVTEDGYLRIIDYLQERLTDVYTSYYGGLLCVCWSPDGKYVLTGGQDDLVSIWSLAERQIVARCSGHDSWVTAVAFDPWRCDEKNYRFGSVGADCKLLLFDFSVGMLHRPKGASTRTRGSISAQSVSLQRHRTESTSIINRIRSDSNRTQSVKHDENRETEFVNHGVEPRARTAQLPPVLSKIVDDHPLCWLGFQEDCIMASCQEGHIRTWDRPKEGVNGSQITLSGASPAG